MTRHQTKLLAALLMAMGLLLGSSGVRLGISEAQAAKKKKKKPKPAEEQQAEKPPVEEKPQAGTDAAGDPLPAHVLARMGTLRWRQQTSANFLAFPPDKKTLVSAGLDGIIHVWDLATGKEVRHFSAVNNLANVQRYAGYQMASTALSPDGKTLAFANANGVVQLWDITTGKEVRQIKHPPAAGLIGIEVVFSPTGKLLATKGTNQQVQVWEVATGNMVAKLGNGQQNNRFFARYGGATMAFTPDGEQLLSADTDLGQNPRQQIGCIRFWQINTGKEIRKFEQQGNLYGAALALSPDGKTLAFGSVNSTAIRLLDAAKGTELRQLNGAGNARSVATTMIFSPDGKTLATRGFDQSTHLWDVAKGTHLRQLGEQTGSNNRYIGRPVAFSPDGKLLAEGGSDSKIHLWEVETGKGLPQAGHQGEITAVGLTPDGKTLLTRSDDSTVRVWDASTGKERNQFRTPRPLAGIFSPDCKKVAIAGSDNSIQVLDANTGKEMARFQVPGQPFLINRYGAPPGLAFSPDGKRLLTRGPDQVIRHWDADKGVKIGELGFVPNFQAGQAIQVFNPYTSLAASMAFSPDSELVAAIHPVPGTAPGQIAGSMMRLWNASTGKLICAFDLQRSSIHALAYSPDGRTVVSVNGDHSVSVWEAVSGQERLHIAPLNAMTGQPQLRAQVLAAGYGKPAACLALSPDGTLAAIGLRNSPAIHLLDLRTGKELGKLEGHLEGVTALGFSADSTRLVSASSDATALVWDLRHLTRPVPEKTALTEQDARDLWKDLADPSARKAFEAIQKLSAAPEQANPLLAQTIKAAEPVEKDRIAQMITDLDSNQFQLRQKATQDLERLAELAEPALQDTLKSKPSLEVRKRIERILDKLVTGKPPSQQVLQALRGVEVLERLATPEARQVLQKLATGAAGDRLTRSATTTLARLAK